MSKSLIMKPIVTVYITCFNYERFVRTAIESVLQQTYKKIDLIVIDDGSTDKSAEIINEYSSKENVRIFFQKNIGLNKTNNKAIKLSKGSYIIRLDADDYFHPKAIEKLVNKLNGDTQAAAVFPDYINVDIYGNEINRVKRINFSKEVTIYDLPAHGACTMLRKGYLKKLGGYDEEFDRQDGYDIWLKIISKYKVLKLNEPLFYYRQHGFNLTKKYQKLLRTRAKIKSKFWIKKFSKIKSQKENLLIIPTRGYHYDVNNIHEKLIAGVPLINWTVNEALNSKGKKVIVISTPCIKTIKKLQKKYANRLHYHLRSSEISNLDISINKTILSILQDFKNKEFENIAVLYPEYPFRKSWQINEAFQTLDIFGADSVDGVILEKSFFYSHKGKGLEPLTKEAYIKYEREEIYKRVGGINAVKYAFFKSMNELLGGRIAHINFDKVSGFKVEDFIDLEISKKIANKLVQ